MTNPTQAQIDAVRRELVGLVIITGDSTWDMDYVARKVLTVAAQVGGQGELVMRDGEPHYAQKSPLMTYKEIEAATIERCAQVADGFSQRTQSTAWQWAAKEIAAAIRKLKDE